MWVGIGIAYYVIAFVVLSRMLAMPSSGRRTIALWLEIVGPGLNAGWNYLFFRLRDVRASFVLSEGYSVVAIALLIVLVTVDRVAASAFLPYAVYLVYAKGGA